MPLSEKQRSQLDTIIQRMEANGEPEEAIQFVVNDFKSKYDPPTSGIETVAGAAALGSAAVPAVVKLASQAANVVPKVANVSTAALPGMLRLPEDLDETRIPERRAVSRARVLKVAGPLLRKANVAKQAYDILTGQQDMGSAILDYAKNEAAGWALGQVPKLGRLAPRLATMTGATGSGALAGLAIPAAFLAAMERDSRNIEQHQSSLSRSIASVLSPARPNVETNIVDPDDPMIAELLRRAR